MHTSQQQADSEERTPTSEGYCDAHEGAAQSVTACCRWMTARRWSGCDECRVVSMSGTMWCVWKAGHRTMC